MRIEKINESKIKIMFNAIELEENNITVHSFLSGSIEAQRLILAILDIANEEFGFDITNSTVSSETISFSNENFVIFVTKSLESCSTGNLKNSPPYNLLDLINNPHTSTDSNETSNFSLSFFPPIDKEKSLENVIYTFENIESLFEFCRYVNLFLNSSCLQNNKLENNLYKYKDMFILNISISNLNDEQKEYLLNMLSEYQNYICLSKLAIQKLKEHGLLILGPNAIQGL